MPTRSNSEPKLSAYKLDGTLLWKIDLEVNIREGAHYTQFMVYDLDGDGIAEIACKTAPGTKDGTGSFSRPDPQQPQIIAEVTGTVQAAELWMALSIIPFSVVKMDLSWLQWTINQTEVETGVTTMETEVIDSLQRLPILMVSDHLL